MSNTTYKLQFEMTTAGRRNAMRCRTGDMSIDTDATLEELRNMPELDQSVTELLREAHPDLRIVMAKVTDIQCTDPSTNQA